MLAEKYGWTPQQVRQLTPAQALMYIEDDLYQETADGKLMFSGPNAMSNYQTWRRLKGFS